MGLGRWVWLCKTFMPGRDEAGQFCQPLNYCKSLVLHLNKLWSSALPQRPGRENMRETAAACPSSGVQLVPRVSWAEQVEKHGSVCWVGCRRVGRSMLPLWSCQGFLDSAGPWEDAVSIHE